MDGQARGLNLWETLAGPIWLGLNDAQVRSYRRGILTSKPGLSHQAAAATTQLCSASLGPGARGLGRRDPSERGAPF